MGLSKAEVSSLVAQLNSKVEAEARHAAWLLDRLLYPESRSGSGKEIESFDEQHFGKIRGSDVVEPLLEAVADGTEFARAYAATVLGAIREPRALPLLLSSLSSPSPTVRLAATKALFFFQEPSTVPALIRSLEDTSLEVRLSAASALGFMGSNEVVLALMAFYERGDRESKVAALRALRFICDPRSLPLAKAALLDKDPQVRKAGKSALSFYDIKRRQGT
jgi:HEAT repeat protein